MRTIPFLQLLRKAQRLCGLARLEPPELAESFAEWLEARLRKAYQRFPWPELCPVEERALRERWQATEDYVPGDVVAHDAGDGTAYYEAQTYVPAALEPGTDEDYWTETGDYERIVAYDQPGENVFHDVLGVYRRDPRRFPAAPLPLGFRLLDDGILLPTDAPATVFIQYRKAPPRLTTTAYDAAATYTPDDVFYLPATGECYVPLETVSGTSPLDLPGLFELQAIPFAVADAAARMAKADYLADDGQDDKAFAQERRAEIFIDDEALDLGTHQQQTASYQLA